MPRSVAVVRRPQFVAALLVSSLPTHGGELASQLEHGAEVFAAACARCHGDDATGGQGYPQSIAGGRNLAKFGDAQRLFVYSQMMMPYDAPGTLPPEDKWAVTAYLVRLGGWLPDDAEALGPHNASDVPLAP